MWSVVLGESVSSGEEGLRASAQNTALIIGNNCDQEALIARQEFITQLSLWDEPSGKKIPLPDACYENDRNRLREFLMSWFLISAKKQSWYRDLGMNTREWLEYLDRNKTNSDKHQQKNNIMRQLCLSALMEEGDVDGDGKMDFAEFRRIMGDSFTPSRKVCQVSDSKHRYADGAERAVECNGCVCACGKWVCTANMCVEGYRDVGTEMGNFGEDKEKMKVRQIVMKTLVIMKMTQKMILTCKG